jgi:hypothetical protein
LVVLQLVNQAGASPGLGGCIKTTITDRQVEYGLRDNAAYSLFSGFGIVDNWHAPDHTKIEGAPQAHRRRIHDGLI